MTEANETILIRIIIPVPKGMPQLYMAKGMPTMPPPTLVEIKAKAA